LAIIETAMVSGLLVSQEISKAEFDARDVQHWIARSGLTFTPVHGLVFPNSIFSQILLVALRRAKDNVK